MFTLQRAIFQSLGISMMKKPIMRDKKKWFHTQVISNPLIVLQLLCCLGISHNIIFIWLSRIELVMYFFSGIIFTLVIEVWIILLIIKFNTDESDIPRFDKVTTFKELKELKTANVSRWSRRTNP